MEGQEISITRKSKRISVLLKSENRREGKIRGRKRTGEVVKGS